VLESAASAEDDGGYCRYGALSHSLTHVLEPSSLGALTIASFGPLAKMFKHLCGGTGVFGRPWLHQSAVID